MTPKNRILPIFIPQLGCPHACVFCNQNEITGAALSEAFRQAERLAGLPAQHGKQELAFYGGSFTAIPVSQQIRFLSCARDALENGAVSAIRLSTRPDAISPSVLERLRRYGVSTIELGAQSMLDPVLKLSGRNHTAEDVRRAALLIREGGFRLVLQMMTGLPGDDDKGAVYTASELIALRPDAVRIYPTVIVRGTELERLWRTGQYREHTVEDAVRVCAELLPMFEAADIPVIRLGLNPTDELSSGGAVAGAYHPALGEMVRSRVLRSRAESLLENMNCVGKTVVITVPNRCLSQMIGQKRSNLLWLTDRFKLSGLRIRTGEDSETVSARVLTETCR